MKYPTTYHLPYTESMTKEDKKHKDLSCFEGKRVIYYEKLDGENTLIGKNELHARSEMGRGELWQTYITKDVKRFQYQLPDEMYLFCENLYAIHSIEYQYLTNYYFCFNILYKGEFLAVDDVHEWCALLEVPICPYFYVGEVNPDITLQDYSFLGNTTEGYVIRNVDSFKKEDFKQNVAKFVRKDHVRTNKHWKKTWKPASINHYKHELLSRKDFREGVFKRDRYKCVFCQKKAKDAHHIIERALWKDEGYYLENGASLCEDCHIKAEKGIYSIEEVRYRANIFNPIMPDNFSPYIRYNKWGNKIGFDKEYIIDLQTKNFLLDF